MIDKEPELSNSAIKKTKYDRKLNEFLVILPGLTQLQSKQIHVMPSDVLLVFCTELNLVDFNRKDLSSHFLPRRQQHKSQKFFFTQGCLVDSQKKSAAAATATEHHISNI